MENAYIAFYFYRLLKRYEYIILHNNMPLNYKHKINRR